MTTRKDNGGSVRGCVLDVDRFATHDGPGIRTAVFLKGCPLSCRWCHSPESQRARPEILYQSERCTSCGLCVGECPAGALSAGEDGRAILDRGLCTACGACAEVCYPGALRLAGRTVSASELAASIERDLPYFRRSGGGMTLSGGEPAAQADFSFELLETCRSRGIHTALETSGHARWEAIEALASVADLVLFDLKLLDPALHKRNTGVTNELILENLSRLAALHAGIHVRVPCITGVNDGEEHIGALAGFVAALGIEDLSLLPYNAAAGAKYRWIARGYALDGAATQSEQTMRRLAEAASRAGLRVRVGG